MGVGGDDMNNQQINKAEHDKGKLIRPLFTMLIGIVIVLNLLVTLDSAVKNRQVKQANLEIEKNIERSKELQKKISDVYEQFQNDYLESQKNNEQLDDLINRFHLHLDQLDQQ